MCRERQARLVRHPDTTFGILAMETIRSAASAGSGDPRRTQAISRIRDPAVCSIRRNVAHVQRLPHVLVSVAATRR